MVQKHLILIDEKEQKETLKSIKSTLKNDGFELIYTELNPMNFQIRDTFGNIDFDVESFKSTLSSIEYFKSADVILCDYNLISGVVNGYDIIKIIRELNYNNKKKIILYSAEIGDAISNILNTNADFEQTKDDLIVFINCNIEFIKRTGYDQEVIKSIKKDPEFDFEEELIKWFYKRNEDTFSYLFPKYEGKSFNEIALDLERKTSQSIEFKKELVEQIIAYLSNINGLIDV